MIPVVIDIESYYNRKDAYDLKSLSLTEYIRDERFKVFGMGVKIASKPTEWVDAENIPTFLRSLCGDNVSLIAHNIKFDGAVLAWRYGFIPKQYVDTMALARALIGVEISSFSLRSLATHFNLPEKGELRSDGLSTLSPEQKQELIDYCKNDVEICNSIYRQLSSQFPVSQWKHVDWTVRAFCCPKLELDFPLLEEAAEEEAKRRANIFKEIGIEKTIFSSNVKFPELLRSKGYEVPMKESPRTAKQIPALALGDQQFQDMLNSENTELADLCEARIAAKSVLLETRSKRMAKVGKTGAFPVDVQFSGAIQTHRYSGGSGSAGNFQNLTRGSVLRKATMAPHGHTLLVGDFAAIELRVAGWLARDSVIMQLVSSGADIYCDFASKIFGRTITKDDKQQRAYGKISSLGLLYGMGWEKFQRVAKLQINMNLSDQFAKKTVDFYRQYYRGIVTLWERLDKVIKQMVEGQSGGFVRSPALSFEKASIILPSGLRLKYPELREEDKGFAYTGYRSRRSQPEDHRLYGAKLLENISQALAGELCKEAIGRCIQRGIAVVGQVHDELLVVAKDENKDVVEQALYQSMTTAPTWWPELQLGAEIGSGKNWMEAKA